MSAWASDLNMLRNDIQGIATEKPEDVETEQCMSLSSVEQIKGRCHSARLISAIWNEKDPFTKVKMLISFYVQSPDQFRYENRIGKLKSDVVQAIQKLKFEERVAIEGFLVWCDKKYPFTKYDLTYVPQRNELFSFIRQNLRASS